MTSKRIPLKKDIKPIAMENAVDEPGVILEPLQLAFVAEHVGDTDTRDVALVANYLDSVVIEEFARLRSDKGMRDEKNDLAERAARPKRFDRDLKTAAGLRPIEEDDIAR
jgi:hypothetical protein